MSLLDTRDLGLIAAIVTLGWVGVWLLLPHRHGGVKSARVYGVGALLGGIALLMILPFLTPPGDLLVGGFFYAFSTLALVGAVLMITSRNPVNSALWFAVVVLSSSGLFLLAGAQFLAAGTVIVYAGAIIVTFLFVIMLAQSHGQAVYDRAARRPLAASLTGMLLLGALLASIVATGTNPRDEGESPLLSSRTSIATIARPVADPVDLVVSQAVPETSRLPGLREPGETPAHVAGLGASLFTDHLLTVQVIGLLLFVALIGAVAIATPKSPIRPDRSTATASPGPAS
ncbi:NADH-quinone oxidoreductase subunit J family protein [Tautonia plasticadhaerens]|uniref:NADH-quinone oxidoreductase subunit J n=1 Tax=Tautonia plasticadhaerens TaxID=2527974 RepID=A0A518H8G4_9BACT|nr:NADH-quinone oxidoreductase subunit J [Tautonia plasticadhaerens]QDV37149.1 NADH-quinone oxidoreductase subunit J [Tautonia plasticadhaerens]